MWQAPPREYCADCMPRSRAVLHASIESLQHLSHCPGCWGTARTRQGPCPTRAMGRHSSDRRSCKCVQEANNQAWGDSSCAKPTFDLRVVRCQVRGSTASSPNRRRVQRGGRRPEWIGGWGVGRVDQLCLGLKAQKVDPKDCLICGPGEHLSHPDLLGSHLIAQVNHPEASQGQRKQHGGSRPLAWNCST